MILQMTEADIIYDKYEQEDVDYFDLYDKNDE